MKKRIWILGDSPLVEEYTSLCFEKEFDVKVRINAETIAQKLPKGATNVDEADRNVELVLELTNISAETKERNLVQLDAILPSSVPILSSSVTVTITEQAASVKQPARLIGIGAFPTLLQGSLIEFALHHQTGAATRSAAENFAASVGKLPAFVEDSVGLIMPRILCMLVNEACFAVMEGVAEASDIDIAMKLGTNYPRGPVEWAKLIGAKHIQAVVAALHAHFGEDRYRIAPLLQKAAASNSLGFVLR
jgi:3-hydroxybutyryl-CoA dehydrogenase